MKRPRPTIGGWVEGEWKTTTITTPTFGTMARGKVRRWRSWTFVASMMRTSSSTTTTTMMTTMETTPRRIVSTRKPRHHRRRRRRRRQSMEDARSYLPPGMKWMRSRFPRPCRSMCWAYPPSLCGVLSLPVPMRRSMMTTTTTILRVHATVVQRSRPPVDWIVSTSRAAVTRRRRRRRRRTSRFIRI